ncbi:MAG: DEAD/DEAH box helicase [Candidatus Aminicenantes bacterium]|nr:DEAD/DEAH box helicase [Candidatus Aminicenantes bacterium]
MTEEPDQKTETLPPLTLAELSEPLRRAAANAGWTELMPVQSQAIPYLLARRDMMIQSRTGSGKTGAFLLPILQLIDAGRPVTQALVLVPTRELAQQVAREAGIVGRDSGVRSIAVYGGVGYGEQLAAFKSGAHLVVGTPGRILDHLLRRSLSLSNLTVLIFDEADRMLSMGFYPDMKRVQAYLPDRPVSTFMFSATYPPQVIRLADQFMREPGILNLSSDHIHVTEVAHVFYEVDRMDKDRGLVRIIEVENPPSALIFCNTKAHVEYVSVVLQRFGYDADALSSDLVQTARAKVMDRIRRGTLRFLVATDVAARGIDLPELSHVFQYEPPEDPEAYIHRAGRTGRAGGSGTAVTLVSGMERADLAKIAARFKIGLQERTLPSDEDVARVASERIIVLLEARLRGRDSLKAERMQRFLSLARSLSEVGDEVALLAMLLDDFYQETFHAPVVPVEPDERSSGSGRFGRTGGRKPMGEGGGESRGPRRRRR